MIRLNDNVMNMLIHYATVTHDNATADAAEMSAQWKRLDAFAASSSNKLDRRRSSWNDIGGRKLRAAAPRAAQWRRADVGGPSPERRSRASRPIRG